MTYSDCCPKKKTYSCYTPCYQKTNYCDCYSCKPTCCPKKKECCPKKEEKCCIPVDYVGGLVTQFVIEAINEVVDLNISGLYLTSDTNRFYECTDGTCIEVVPSKKITKFLDCTTKNLYTLTYDSAVIECTLIKKIEPKDCINLLCTTVEVPMIV